MDNINEKWTVSQNEESFNQYEYFDTKEKAIAFGRKYKEFEGKSFYVGQVESIPMRASCLGVQIIEYIQEDHFNEDGECAEDYLNNVKREHIDELDKMLETAILEWAIKYDYQPKHFFVKNIESVEMGDLFKVKGISLTHEGRVGNCPHCGKFITQRHDEVQCNFCSKPIFWKQRGDE